MKKPEAILYTSNAGHTKAYAELLGREVNLPVLSLKDAGKRVSKGAPVIYLGWLMGGNVSGYKKAKESYSISCLIGVGMMKNGNQVKDIREKNPVTPDLPVFSLQGGLELEKLHGFYRLMMKVAAKGTTKGLLEKKDRTPEEEEVLRLFSEGGDFVSLENLKEVLEWYRDQA